MPDAVVLVCPVRALKDQSGRFQVHQGRPLPENLLQDDLDAVAAGSISLQAHIDACDDMECSRGFRLIRMLN
jgi:formate--tetrahydrofolate ligase